MRAGASTAHGCERQMSNASRVYVARMAGLVVFDPNGDQVGRVRDAVVRALARDEKL